MGGHGGFENISNIGLPYPLAQAEQHGLFWVSPLEGIILVTRIVAAATFLIASLAFQRRHIADRWQLSEQWHCRASEVSDAIVALTGRALEGTVRMLGKLASRNAPI